MDTVAKRLESAVAAVSESVEAVFSPQQQKTQEELWNELMSCILGSQVPFEMADAASRKLIESGIFDRTGYVDQCALQREVFEVLSRPIEVGARTCRYRFPFVKSCQLSKAFLAIRQSSIPLFSNNAGADVRVLRCELVRHVPGVGPKQASMFLRNIGVTYDLAIIDSHVLKFMHLTGLISSTRAPGSMKSYEIIESKLSNFCRKIGRAVGHVDRAIWVVMRVAQREALV